MLIVHEMALFRNLSAVLLLFIFIANSFGSGNAHRCFKAHKPCKDGEVEIYHDERPHRKNLYLCCPSDEDSGVISDQEAKATVCIPSGECIKVSESGGDLCASLGKRTVNTTGQTFSFVEAVRDDCLTHSNAQGVEALCCGEGTTDLMLTTLLAAEKHEFPHFARFEYNTGRMVDMCGGTVYNERYVITASHCVVDKKQYKSLPKDKMSVFLDILISGLKSSNKFGVEEVHIHPNASLLNKTHTPLHNDIAILKLDRDIKFSDRIQALPLAPKGFQPEEYGNTAIIVGFGDTDTLKPSKKLQKGDAYIRNTRASILHVGAHFRRYHPYQDQLLFLGGFQGGTPSISGSGGDSGGPAVCRDKQGNAVLCGLTSFGSGNKDRCEKFQNIKECAPTAYVRIDHFRDWIEKTAGNQSKATVLKQSLYGKDVKFEKYPSQVVIKTEAEGKDDLGCGGTLISKDIVLTAAHCVTDSNSKMKKGLMITHKITGAARHEDVTAIKVLEGFKRIGKPSGGRPKRIAAFAAIPTWDAPYYKNDLALLKLSKPLRVDVSKLPKIPMNQTEPGMAMEVAWINGNDYHKARKGKLVEREFELMTHTECQKRMDRLKHAGAEIKVDGNIVCGVEKYSGGSKCDRTLGGGLICEGNVLCGVQAFRLCEFAVPSAFMDVGSNGEWIKKNMKKL